MSSRLKQDPEKIFDVFIEFVRETGDGGQGKVVQYFPDNFDDEKILRQSIEFAFPYSFGRNRYTQEYFAFVMTDINGKFKFGFCKLLSGITERNYCIISCLPWFDSFQVALDELSGHMMRQNNQQASSILHYLHQSPPLNLPSILCLTSPDAQEKINFECPLLSPMPSIPDDRNLTELFKTLKISNLMILFASMLFERRILLHSSSIFRVTSCIHGMNQIIYPLTWQHLFIPILPPPLLDYCSAPMPYIIGLHSSLMTSLKKFEYSDAVLVDVDDDKIQTEHSDLACIPRDVLATLKKQLKQQKALLEKNQTIGDGVSRAFLGVMVSLIGNYRNAMRFHDGSDITFDPDVFVAGGCMMKDTSSSASKIEYTRFLTMVLHMQSFQQFINDRLDIMNAGKGFQDALEEAVSMMSGEEDRWKTQSRYKEWMGHMKKQGKILKREGRDKWSIFATKVKGKSKKTWKEIKSKLDEGYSHHGANKNFPTNNPKSKFHLKLVAGDPLRKPPRPPPPVLPLSKEMLTIGLTRRTSLERTQHYNLLDVDSLNIGERSIDSSDDSSLNCLRRVDTDLCNDPDLRPWMMRPSRNDIFSDMTSLTRKSYSVEGLCNVKSEEGDSVQESLDTSVTLDGKNVLMNLRSLSSANMLAKNLEILDLSSTDSNSTDLPSREGSTTNRANTAINIPQHVMTSYGSIFKTNNINSNEFVTHSQEQLHRVPPQPGRGQKAFHEDLMNFDSSSSSLEFDPLKQKFADASFIDHHPVPMPRNRPSAYNGNRSFTVVAYPNEGPEKEVKCENQNQNGYKSEQRPAALPPPKPMPRKRDTTSLQYYHHSRQVHPINAEHMAVAEIFSQNINKFELSQVTSDQKNCGPAGKDRQAIAMDLKQRKAAFMQSDYNIQLPQLGLESFDPLASGQLIIDPPVDMLMNSSGHNNSDGELLKDWSLKDLSKPPNCANKFSLPATRISQAAVPRNNLAPFNYTGNSPNTFQSPLICNQFIPSALRQEQLSFQRPLCSAQNKYHPVTGRSYLSGGSCLHSPSSFVSIRQTQILNNLASSKPTASNNAQKSLTLPQNTMLSSANSWNSTEWLPPVVTMCSMTSNISKGSAQNARHGKVWETFE